MAATLKSQSTHAAKGPQAPDSAAAPSHSTVDVIALTTRDDFLLELGQCLDGMASIVPVETSALALAAAGQSRHAQVLVVDSRDLADLRAEVDLLHLHAPTLSALVFAPQDVESRVAEALKGSSVFAVLPLPIDPRKTAALFEGAAAEAETRRGAARAASAAPKAHAAPAAEPATRPAGQAHAHAHAHSHAHAHAPPAATATAAQDPASRREAAGGGRSRGVAIAGAACLVVAAAAAWFLTREDSPPPPAATPEPAAVEPIPSVDSAAAVPSVQGDVDELLEKARVAIRERRYVEPANNSALLYYGSAAEADPGNAEALDGLSRMRPLIVERFDELAKAGRHEAAGAALAQLQGALPDDPAIPGMRLRLASARVAKAIEEGDAARATELVRSAQAVGTVPAEQLAKWRAEINALSEKTRQEQAAERQAREAAAAAQKARDAKAAAAAREAQAARDREAAQKIEAQRAEQAALAASKAAEGEAAARARAAVRVEPKLKRNVRPEYPSDALEKGIEGVVIVAYTVDVEGRTQDVQVQSADPPGVFDQATINAVKRWRFEPATVDGVPTEAQMSITIRFAQPK